MKKVYITVGVPGSGKTTYIKNNFKDFDKNNIFFKDKVRKKLNKLKKEKNNEYLILKKDTILIKEIIDNNELELKYKDIINEIINKYSNIEFFLIKKHLKDKKNFFFLNKIINYIKKNYPDIYYKEIFKEILYINEYIKENYTKEKLYCKYEEKDSFNKIHQANYLENEFIKNKIKEQKDFILDGANLNIKKLEDKIKLIKKYDKNNNYEIILIDFTSFPISFIKERLKNIKREPFSYSYHDEKMNKRLEKELEEYQKNINELIKKYSLKRNLIIFNNNLKKEKNKNFIIK